MKMIEVGLEEMLKSQARTEEQGGIGEHDPMKFLRKYGNRHNQEILGFIASWLSYGRESLVTEACQKVYDEMSNLGPYLYIKNRGWAYLAGSTKNLHHFFTWGDFSILCGYLKEIYDNHENMEQAMNYQLRISKKDSPTDYLAAMIRLFPGMEGVPKNTKSACMRLNLFLRWMVRKNSPIDLGIWASVEQQDLLISLSSNTAKVARNLGLLKRKNIDMRATLELTGKMAKIFPNDPSQGDYAFRNVRVLEID